MRHWSRVLGSLHPDDRVAIAVSGGADSVALTWILHELGARQRGANEGWRVVGLVHVNHGLRGADSAADEAFCRELAARLSWPIDVSAVDVRARARARKQSIETAARGLRYESFEAAADRLGATVVATAHTMDDQAETVLLRLLRGAGTRGLSGIRARRGRFVRPLLEHRRAELRAYLASRGEPFRDDVSNADRSIPRNRLRHELMPVLEQFAPGAVAALARCAALAADDERVLEELARQSALAARRGDDALDVDALAALTPAIARRVVRLTAERVCPGVMWSARHLEAVRMLAQSVDDRMERHLDLPGVNLARRGPVLTFRPHGAGRIRVPGFDWPLAVPGATDIPELGATIHARRGAAPAAWPPVSNGRVAVLDAGALALPLRVRNRRPGDRLKPIGAPGRRKLQDLFVDRKIPREDRDRVPIVVDATGRIVWVAGLAVAEECTAATPEASMVILELT
jgi:tRNA(Ile)-lysidine synthetase-like protein